ncbi:MAG: DUF2232 domain-containing protein [Ancalomicrobiaceae bacterium]|nr:DUF2232 domain-containing protein [Ancalomicrobiaceae bacterium]
MRLTLSFRTIAIGVVAGLASALLMLSPAGGSALAVPLTAAVGLPLVIVSLGWGTAAGIVAVVVASAATAFGHPLLALDFAVFFAPPAVVGSHLIGLARPRPAAPVVDPGMPAPPKSDLEWYPLGRMAAIVALIAAAAAVGIAFFADFNPAALSAEQINDLTAIYAQMMSEGGPAPTADDLAAIRQGLPVMLALLPLIFTAVWTLIALINLYLGAWIAARSDKLARPWEDVAGFEPPLWATLAFFAAVAFSTFGGTFGALALALAGGFAMLHLLVGLGVAHTVTRGWALRVPLLITIYVLFGLFALPLLVIGLIERFARLRAWARGRALAPPSR